MSSSIRSSSKFNAETIPFNGILNSYADEENARCFSKERLLCLSFSKIEVKSLIYNSAMS